jgi:hypothetical protein
VSAAVLSRINRGAVPDLGTYIKLCRWMGKSLDEYVTLPGGVQARIPG